MIRDQPSSMAHSWLLATYLEWVVVRNVN